MFKKTAKRGYEKGVNEFEMLRQSRLMPPLSHGVRTKGPHKDAHAPLIDRVEGSD